MKITPIEIRQHSFEKGLRGYKTEEVDAFLNSLSQEWERIISENKMLKMQLELAEKELNKLKEVELVLFKTLKTAEDTSSQITEQANRAAEQYMGESKQKADELLAEARKKSTLMVQDAENQARYIKENILNDLKSIENDFKAMERYKENMIVQIQTLANNAMDSVDRFEKKFARQSIRSKIDEVTAQIDVSEAQPTEAAQTPQPVEAAGETPAAVTELEPLVEQEKTAALEAEAAPATIEGIDEAVEHQAHPEAVSQEEQTEPAPVEPEEPVNQPEAVTAEEPATAEMPVEAGVPQAETKKSGGSFFDQI